MIFSILTFITLFISISVKDRNKSLKIQSINCIFESLYAFTIKAYTAAFLGIVNFIRSRLFINKEHFSKRNYLILLFIFQSIIIINCILTFEGIISLFPTVGAIIRTYCLWQSNMKYIRLSAIISGLLFAIYYTYYQSWFMVFGYLLLAIISLYNIYTKDLKNKI